MGTKASPLSTWLQQNLWSAQSWGCGGCWWGVCYVWGCKPSSCIPSISPTSAMCALLDRLCWGSQEFLLSLTPCYRLFSKARGKRFETKVKTSKLPSEAASLLVCFQLHLLTQQNPPAFTRICSFQEHQKPAEEWVGSTLCTETPTGSVLLQFILTESFHLFRNCMIKLEIPPVELIFVHVCNTASRPRENLTPGA